MRTLLMTAPRARRAAGFTLIELMVALAIVAILAAVALPYYGDYVKRGNITEATANLSTLRVNMEQYYQDNGNYGTNGACGVAMPTIAGGIVKNFNFACVATSSTGGAADDGYVITATGGTAAMNGFAYTIDNLNNRVSALTAAGWANPNPNTCWATKKGGIC